MQEIVHRRTLTSLTVVVEHCNWHFVQYEFTVIVVNPLRFSKLSGSYDHTARGQLFSFTQYISLHRIINNEHLGHVRLVRIGIRIQISDPSDPSDSTEHFIWTLTVAMLTMALTNHPKRVNVVLIASVVQKVNKLALCPSTCAYHSVYKNDFYPPYTHKGHIWIRWIRSTLLPEVG